MNTHNKSMITITLSVLPLIMFASVVEAGPTYICHHHDATREIEVVYDQIGQTVPCHVVYRKAEGEQTLWSAQAEEGFCEEKARTFAAKQESWGWTCSVNTDEEASQEDPINADNLDQFQLEETVESVEEELENAAEDIEEAAEASAEETAEAIEDAAAEAEAELE